MIVSFMPNLEQVFSTANNQTILFSGAHRYAGALQAFAQGECDLRNFTGQVNHTLLDGQLVVVSQIDKCADVSNQLMHALIESSPNATFKVNEISCLRDILLKAGTQSNEGCSDSGLNLVYSILLVTAILSLFFSISALRLGYRPKLPSPIGFFKKKPDKEPQVSSDEAHDEDSQLVSMENAQPSDYGAFAHCSSR